MRSRIILVVVIATMFASMIIFGQSQGKPHLNPMVELLLQHKPVFGIYLPAANALPGAPPRGGFGAPRGAAAGGRGGAVGSETPRPQEDPCGDAAKLVANPPSVPKLTPDDIQQQADLARLALLYRQTDYLFSGNFEEGVDRPLPAFSELMKDLSADGVLVKSPTMRLMPVMLKAPKVGCDPKAAIGNFSRELNLGASGLMFPHTASAKELQDGLNAMRFKSNGGTRPDDVGAAPAHWGMTAQQYKEKADLYTLNPNGELVNFTIIEDKDGLAHRREIAAVKGIGVLWPGAGTLGGVFQKQNAEGRWVRDDVAWEEAIQQVLAACKEFNVPCAYPANSVDDLNKRMQQGFSVFVSSWGDTGFQAIDAGRKASGRTATTKN